MTHPTVLEQTARRPHTHLSIFTTGYNPAAIMAQMLKAARLPFGAQNNCITRPTSCSED